jgi:ketosteroid isomerase-like protein
MKHGRFFLAILTLTALAVCRPSHAAAPEVDPAGAEAAVRKTDAAWDAAASTAGVDGWMAFYGDDAIVRLPDGELTFGKELLRRSVSRLLAQPRLSIAWRPVKAEIARSGDLASLIGTYEVRMDDSHGIPASYRGRRLEIFRKQSDGTWKCTVDTWNLDEPVATPSAALSAAPSGASSASGSGRGATAGSGAPAEPQQSSSAAATKYGDMPTDYQAAIREYFLAHLKSPESVQYREIGTPVQGFTTAVTGAILMKETRQYGWSVKATINAKNSNERYVGFKTYTFLFHGGKIVDVRSPLPGDEMK